MTRAFSVAVASTAVSLLLHGILLWFSRSDIEEPPGGLPDERRILFSLVEPRPIDEPDDEPRVPMALEPKAAAVRRADRHVARPPTPPDEPDAQEVPATTQQQVDAEAVKHEHSTDPPAPDPRPHLDLRAAEAVPSAPSGRILAGLSPLPFQPRPEQLFAVLDPPVPEIERRIREDVAAPRSVPERVAQELRPLVNSLELAWRSSSREHFATDRVATLSDVLEVFSGGAPQWGKQYERYLASTEGARDPTIDPGDVRGSTFVIGDTVDVLAQLDHDESGSVTRVTIIESSGDKALDEWLTHVAARTATRGSPTVLTSFIRFRASTEVVIPSCGATQESPSSRDITNRGGATRTMGCAFSFDEVNGVQTPLSRRHHSTVTVEEAILR